MSKINHSGTLDFFDSIAQIIEKSRAFVGRATDITMCVTYFEVGRMIVEEEQGGNARAEYGKGLLPKLSSYLNERVGKGYSESTLKNARKFYQAYAPSIRQNTFAELKNGTNENIGESIISIFNDNDKIRQTIFAESYPFTLGWSHYLILMRISDEQERRFYEIEATKQQWTYEQLKRQYGSSLYERLALSRDKEAVMKLSTEGQIVEKPRDILKNPLVLEFTGMEESHKYSEDDLELAIISKMQMFLLELGKGFLFEARQKRFTFNEEHFKVDLILYNRLLKCYVLIDIKIGAVKHQDLGQMQMYVHYYDRYVKTDDEHPTIGILLCRVKNDAIVELTLPTGENIFASEYSLYLPDKALLQRKLAEWIKEFEDAKAICELADFDDDENQA
jgi:predicted nuclease of restriction endonuclease-like (RecB) superfamily